MKVNHYVYAVKIYFLGNPLNSPRDNYHYDIYKQP